MLAAVGGSSHDVAVGSREEKGREGEVALPQSYGDPQGSRIGGKTDRQRLEGPGKTSETRSMELGEKKGRSLGSKWSSRIMAGSDERSTGTCRMRTLVPVGISDRIPTRKAR